MKRCSICKSLKATSEFYKSASTKDGLLSGCKRCRYIRENKNPEKQQGRSRKWRALNPEKHHATERNCRIKRTYGITQYEFDVLASKQNYSCLICTRKPKRLVVDHDHGTGEIRGLLCASCNCGIGYLRDDPSIVHSAYRYLLNPFKKAQLLDDLKEITK